jgi:hypothetical protein
MTDRFDLMDNYSSWSNAVAIRDGGMIPHLISVNPVLE